MVPEEPGRGIYNFSKFCLGYDLLEWEVHGPLCAVLETLYFGRSEVLSFPDGSAIKTIDCTMKVDEKSVRTALLLMPRGGLKTTIVTQTFPAWTMILNDPTIGHVPGPADPPASFNQKLGFNQRFLIGQEVSGMAVRYHKTIQRHFETNPLIHEYFGRLAPAKRSHGNWTAAESDVLWREDRKAKEKNFTITSLDSAVNSGHYDIAILDDMISEKQVTNEEQIRQTIEFHNQLFPIMEKPSIQIYVGTRWSDYDLYGYLQDPEHGEAKNLIVYREQATRSDEEVAQGFRPLFFPQVLTEGVLKEAYDRLGPYFFSCQYQNDPIDQATAVFKKEYFENQLFDLDSIKSSPGGFDLWLGGKTVFTTCDPAISKDRRACFATVTTCAWDHRGHMWILDVFRRRGCLTNDYLDAIENHVTLWDPIQVGIEEIGFQQMYRHAADERLRDGGKYIPWKALKPSHRAKEYRIERLEPLARMGRIHVQRQHQFVLEEFLRYPRGRTRDVIDALAYQPEIAYRGKKPKPKDRAPTDAEIAKRAFEANLRRLGITSSGGKRGVRDWYNM